MKNTVKQKPIGSLEMDKYFTYEINDDIINRERLCDYTSLVNYHTKGLDMGWGTIWIWNKRAKEYQSPFYHHTWNLDDNDNVYDDYYSLNKVLERGGINSVDVKRDSYQYVDGSTFKISNNPEVKDLPLIAKKLKKRFSSKGYKSLPKMVFLSEVAWDKNDNPHSWESMEKRWSKMEKNEIIEEIQR